MRTCLFILGLLMVSQTLMARPLSDSELMTDFEGLDEVSFAAKIQDLSKVQKAILVSKNVGEIVAMCPTSHAVQFMVAAGETVPVVSAFTRLFAAIGHIIANDQDRRSQDIADYNNSIRPGMGFVAGGPTTVLVEFISQLLGDSNMENPHLFAFDVERLEQALRDGYFATREMQNWNQVCYRAERRVEMLGGIKTRLK